VAERLWRISQLGTTEGDFLREHPEVIAEIGDGLEHGRRNRQVRLAVFPRPHQRLNQPECAHHKRAFAAANSYIVEPRVRWVCKAMGKVDWAGRRAKEGK
jgi:hypothetical protein